MATFVLVHGGGHGGWCYQRVARILRAQGQDVYTPTMTGLGEREQEDGPEEKQGGQHKQKTRPPLAIHIALRQDDAKPVAHRLKNLAIRQLGDWAIWPLARDR